MDSYAEQPTAVWIHKPSDWLLLRFIKCVIDRCWHNSCQRRKWRLTNDSAGSAVWEITSALCEATRQSSLCLSQCLFTATLNHCRTDNAGQKGKKKNKKRKKTSNKYICTMRRRASPVVVHTTSKTPRWQWSSCKSFIGTSDMLLNMSKLVQHRRMGTEGEKKKKIGNYHLHVPTQI